MKTFDNKMSTQIKIFGFLCDAAKACHYHYILVGRMENVFESPIKRNLSDQIEPIFVM